MKFYQKFIMLVILILVILIFPSAAYAMHISEGILPVNWSVLWSLIAFIFIAIGIFIIKKKDKEDPAYSSLLGLFGAAVFVLSLLPIPVPVVGSSSHPAGTGIAAIFIGPFPAVVISTIALLIQALFLAHGGLTTLGANILAMGVAGSFMGYLAFFLLRKIKAPLSVSAFAAGFIGDIATYAATSVFLGLGIAGNKPALSIISKIFIVFMPIQIPLAILEGLIASYMIAYIYNNRPEILYKLKVVKKDLAYEN